MRRELGVTDISQGTANVGGVEFTTCTIAAIPDLVVAVSVVALTTGWLFVVDWWMALAAVVSVALALMSVVLRRRRRQRASRRRRRPRPAVGLLVVDPPMAGAVAVSIAVAVPTFLRANRVFKGLALERGDLLADAALERIGRIMDLAPQPAPATPRHELAAHDVAFDGVGFGYDRSCPCCTMCPSPPRRGRRPRLSGRRARGSPRSAARWLDALKRRD